MKWFRDMKTPTKLMLIIGMLALVAAISAVVGINNAASFNEQLYELRYSALSLDRDASARADILAGQVALKNYILVEDARLRYPGDIARYEQQIWDYLDERMATTIGPDTIKINQDMQAGWTAYTEKTDSIVYMDEWNDAEAIRLSMEEADPAALEVESQLKILASQDVKDINDQITLIEDSVKQAATLGRWTLILLAGLIILGVYVTNHISRPLLSLTNAIVAFENNTYKPEMLATYTRRNDELGQLSRAVNSMASSITESNRLKEQFINSASRFIPTQYIEFLEKPDITKVSLGDNVAAEMAVMFSDIRGFTTMSEKMTPQENFDFVNEYLKLVSPIVQQHEGFVVKFLGDGMMAIFPYGVDDAVQAGIEKQQQVKVFNDVLRQRGLPEVTVGIGIHTGHMMVGMIGEELRMQGDAFSDNVNLTSRLEGLNKFYGTSMIISEDTLRQLKQPVTYKMRYLGKAIVKGRETPLGLYEVYQGLPDEITSLKDATKADFERGIQFYTSGKFAEARQAFNAVLDRDPKDKTAQYYLERCSEWIEHSLPTDWNGAIVMDSK
jgi:class 3 adenylate cyclase